MKKGNLFLSLVLSLALLIAPVVHASKIQEYHRDITVQANCEKCKASNPEGIEIELFADGEGIQTATLDKSNDYKTVFTNLPIVKEDNITEIIYSVKGKKDGKTIDLLNEKSNATTKHIEGWYQAPSSEIKNGEDYVIVTDNWNSEQNGRTKFVMLNHDMGLTDVNVVSEMNNINGVVSKTRLDIDSNGAAIWNFAKYNKNDEYSKYYQGNWWRIFDKSDTNGKHIALRLRDFVYQFRNTARTGYYPEDNSLYTGYMRLDPIEDTGRAYMWSYNIIGDNPEELPKQYMGVDFNANLTNQSVPEYSAQFRFYKYFDSESNTIATNLYDTTIEFDLCEEEPEKEPKVLPPSEALPDNPNTIDDIILGFVGIISSITFATIIVIISKKKLSI